MGDSYEELFEGDRVLRFPPGERHEQLCEKLELLVAQIIGPASAAKLLPRRSGITLSPNTVVHPDLALVTKANQRLILAIEVISSEDHRPDTVSKKGLYEDHKIPRLWMVDPRYNNVEVYHGTAYGLALKEILAGSKRLTDSLLPGFDLEITDLFQE